MHANLLRIDSQCFDIDVRNKAPLSPGLALHSESDWDSAPQDRLVPRSLAAISLGLPYDRSSSSSSSSSSSESDVESDEDFISLFKSKQQDGLVLDTQRFSTPEQNTHDAHHDLDTHPTLVYFDDGSFTHSLTYEHAGMGHPVTRTITRHAALFGFGGCSSKAFEESVDALLSQSPSSSSSSPSTTTTSSSSHSHSHSQIQIRMDVETTVHREAAWDEAVKKALRQTRRMSKRDAIYVEV